MNKRKLLILLVTIPIVLFISYIFAYQYLVNKGSELVDDHCINVNPHIIDRKNTFNDQYKIMMSSDTSQFKSAFNRYIVASKAYINAEKMWLPKDKALLDSPLFNLILPIYLKDAAKFQYQMYEADYLSSVYINEALDEKDQAKQLELSRMTVEEAKKRDEFQDKYNAIWDKNAGKKDWIFNIVKIPPSKCPAKNNDIPNTPNLFAPIETPTPASANPDSPAS